MCLASLPKLSPGHVPVSMWFRPGHVEYGKANKIKLQAKLNRVSDQTRPNQSQHQHQQMMQQRHQESQSQQAGVGLLSSMQSMQLGGLSNNNNTQPPLQQQQQHHTQQQSQHAESPVGVFLKNRKPAQVTTLIKYFQQKVVLVCTKFYLL